MKAKKKQCVEKDTKSLSKQTTWKRKLKENMETFPGQKSCYTGYAGATTLDNW